MFKKLKKIFSVVFQLFVLFIFPVYGANTVVFMHFEGCIVDSMNLEAKVFVKFLNAYGYKKSDGQPFSMEDFEKMREQSFDQIVKEIGISNENLKEYLNRFQEAFSKNIDKLKPVEGLRKFLEFLRSKGYEFGIATSNSKENVDKFLQQNNLKEFFKDELICTGNWQDILKEEKMLDKLLAKEHIDAKDVIYWGNGLDDAQAVYDSATIRDCALLGNNDTYSSWDALRNWINNHQTKDKTFYLFKDLKEGMDYFMMIRCSEWSL